MNKRLLTLAAPVAAMGAALLLGACGQSGSAAAPSTTAAPTSAAAASAPSSTAPSADKQRGTGDGRGHQVDPPTKKPTAKEPAGSDVKCGSVGAGYVLVADSTPEGTTGCTEAFNVLDEYQKAPVDQGEGGSQRNKKLSGGWSCGTDGGSGPQAAGLIACTTGKPDGHGGTVGGLAFHTERAR